MNFSLQGVIFSINCDIEHGLMTTTSDDRSVKIWKINFPSTDAPNWADCAIKQVKSLFGHTARVFRCKIIADTDVPYIVSIGEDSNVCVWSDSGSLLYRRRFNSGATLWHLDYSPETQVVFVCGSDGNVREVALKNVFRRLGASKEVISNEILLEGEYLAKVKTMDDAKIVALTSSNRLIYQNKCNEWSVCAFDNYKSCLLEKFERFIAIAGYRRASVFEYDQSNDVLHLIYEFTGLQNMVRSLSFLNETEYLLSDETGNCTLISRTSSQTFRFSLPTYKDTYVTVALKTQNFLIVGDRTGDLHLFEIETNDVHLRHRLKQVHGNLGCTVLYAENGAFVTSGHDGTKKVIALNATHKILSVTLSTKLPVIWMERIIRRSDNKKLYAGFNDKHFVLADDEGDIVDEIDCGGGHRFWDLSLNGTDGRFIFIRNKMLYSVALTGYADGQQKTFRIPLHKWHMKSCNSMECVRMPNGNVILVSGGDDNVIRVNKFSETNESFIEPIAVVEQHISCIKAVTTLEAPTDPNQRIVVSAGGRAQICVSKLILNENNGQITAEEISNFMLNSTDVQRKRLGKSQTIDFDPETRFMSVSCTEDLQIIAGCSDGYVRQFQYDATNGAITSLASIFYGKCLLHTYHFRFDDTNKYLLTMATDGDICFWEIHDRSIHSEPFHRLQHHHSGINSFDVLPSTDRLIIATGGDDQSVVISKFSLQKNRIESIETNRLNYHTAQVNGMKFSSDGSVLYTVSVDQVLCAVDVETMTPVKIAKLTVADAKGLQIVRENRILVYGSGIQLIKIAS